MSIAPDIVRRVREYAGERVMVRRSASFPRDTVATLEHPEVLERPKNSDGVGIFDCADSLE